MYVVPWSARPKPNYKKSHVLIRFERRLLVDDRRFMKYRLDMRCRTIRAILVVLALSVVFMGGMLFTWQGYYWLHAAALRQTVREITAYGKINSLEMGDDGFYSNDAGEIVHYDSYRFLNGKVITHYPRQHKPDAEQPSYFIDIFCQMNGLSKERYLYFRSRLEDLGLQGFSLDPESGSVSFILINEGGNPIVTSLVYVPTNQLPHYLSIVRKVASHWYVIEQG